MVIHISFKLMNQTNLFTTVYFEAFLRDSKI